MRWGDGGFVSRRGWALGAVLASAGVAWACGPFFPERMLLDRSGTLLRAPRARLAEEIAAMKTPAPPLKGNWAREDREFPHAQQTVEVDVQELTEALAGKPDADALVKRYREVRALLWSLTVAPANGGGGARVPPLVPPEGIPAEFADYLAGAIVRARGDTVSARQRWERLLQRPPPERRYRSTWAAYMLAVSYRGVDLGKSARWFQETRTLAAQGFRDGLGLGAASLGREAQGELQAQNFDRAAQLYLESSALGDPYGPASLRELSTALLRAAPDAQKAPLKQPRVREVLGIYLASSDAAALDPGSPEVRLHGLLLQETQGEKDLAGADRLAWFAYQRGAFEDAAAWLQRAPEGSPRRAWIGSKLLARKGNLKEAATELSRAVDAFPLAPQPAFDEEELPHAQRLRAELAVLKLGRGQFVESLDLLMQAGTWRDAAHVAERVLTLDELRAVVDRSWPEPPAKPSSPGDVKSDPEELPALRPAELLRYLLARRLARAGQWKEALPYFPEPLRPRVKAYLAASAVAQDPRQGKPERARALWEMAQSERHKGMELLGMELGPDWRVDVGQFDEDEQVGKPVLREKLALRSAGEERRVKQSAPAYTGRFHYRYIAAKRALEASRLLPDGDPRIGEMLCAASGWLKARDAKAAAPYAEEARRRKASCP